MASKRNIRRHACEGKRRFATAESAYANCRVCNRRPVNKGDPMNVYRCSFCGGYHLGHPGMRGKPKRNRSNFDRFPDKEYSLPEV
jgi:hypothetical protein